MNIEVPDFIDRAVMTYKASEEGQSLIRGGRYSEFALGSVKAALEALVADPIMPTQEDVDLMMAELGDESPSMDFLAEFQRIMFRHRPTFNERLMPIVAGLADCPDPSMRELLLGDLNELVEESQTRLPEVD